MNPSLVMLASEVQATVSKFDSFFHRVLAGRVTGERGAGAGGGKHQQPVCQRHGG